MAPVPSLLRYQLPENCQPRVVEADIQRSLWALYPETTERDRMRGKLKDMILRILAHHRDRYYYQGLHELMGYVMYVLAPSIGSEMIVSVCEQLLLTRWRSFSEPRLAGSESMLYAMHAIIVEEDTALAVALEECGVGPESHYAVSWVITWYTHCLTNLELLGRLFDFFIGEPDELGVIFFTAAFVVHERERILGWIAQDKAESGDYGDAVVLMARVYSQITSMAKDVLDTLSVEELNSIIVRASTFRNMYAQVARSAADNFMAGDVRKLGMLANARTRNAALRLLWRLLPREWRYPAERHSMSRWVLWGGVAVVAALIAISKGREQ